jgi:primosomal replication protein N
LPHNQLAIGGRLVELKSLRHTPAGVPVTEFRLEHESRQAEAGADREVRCELSAVAIGDLARLVQGAKLGDAVRASGFLANRGKSARQLVLHVTDIEFLEGN